MKERYGTSEFYDNIKMTIISEQFKIADWQIPNHEKAQNMTLLEKSLHNLNLPLVNEVYDVHRTINGDLVILIERYFNEIADRIGRGFVKPLVGEKYRKVDKELASYYNEKFVYQTSFTLKEFDKKLVQVLSDIIHNLQLRSELNQIRQYFSPNRQA